MNNPMGELQDLKQIAFEIKTKTKRTKELQRRLDKAARQSPREYGNRSWVIIPPTQ